MAWKFRKRLRLFPGFSINLSKSGMSATVGMRGRILSGCCGVCFFTLFFLGYACEKGEARASNYSKLQTIDLKTGLYGVPFNASLPDLLQWASERNLAVLNPTEETLKQKQQGIQGRNEMLKDATPDFYRKSAEGQLVSAIADAQMQSVAAEDNLVISNVRSQPTFSYKDQSYYLVPVVNIINPNECAKPWVESAYRVEFSPSQEMQNDGVGKLAVFLLRGEKDKMFKVYATLATMTGATEEQIGNIFFTLTSKYGEPIDTTLITTHRDVLTNMRDNPWSKSKEIREKLSEVLGGVTDSSGNIIDYFGKNPNDGSQITLWGTNIVGLYKPSDTFSFSSAEHCFFYYKPELAQEVTNAHKTALERCAQEQASNEVKKSQARQSNF